MSQDTPERPKFSDNPPDLRAMFIFAAILFFVAVAGGLMLQLKFGGV